MIDFDAFDFTVWNGKLSPANIHTEDKMGGYKNGDVVSVKLHKPRNEGYHKHVFGVISKVARYEKLNGGKFKDPDLLYEALKRATNRYDVIVSPFDGTNIIRVKSFSKRKADQVEFQKWWEDEAVPFLAEYLSFDPYELLERRVR